MTTDTEPAITDLTGLATTARRLRRHIITMTTAAGSGHPSSALSMVELLTALYFGGVLQHDPQHPRWPDRDRFILSKGHGCPALYAALAEAGYFPCDWLEHLREIGWPLEGHPKRHPDLGIEAAAGSLGQGLSIAIGHALAARLDNRALRVYCLLGDGECQEGQVWEAAMAAAHFGLDNLTAIIDHNKYQQTGPVFETMDYRPFADKWRASRWHVEEIDGHDQQAVLDAFHRVQPVTGQPQVIIAHTVKGKGVSLLENDFSWHGKALSPEQAEAALAEIGA